MKTAKLLITAIACILIVSVFIGCAEVVSKTAINTEYIAAYDAMETVYEYKYDWYHGDWAYLPVYKNVHHQAEYKVQYLIVYADGTEDRTWYIVSKDEYDSAVQAIKECSAQK